MQIKVDTGVVLENGDVTKAAGRALATVNVGEPFDRIANAMRKSASATDANNAREHLLHVRDRLSRAIISMGAAMTTSAVNYESTDRALEESFG